MHERDFSKQNDSIEIVCHDNALAIFSTCANNRSHATRASRRIMQREPPQQHIESFMADWLEDNKTCRVYRHSDCYPFHG